MASPQTINMVKSVTSTFLNGDFDRYPDPADAASHMLADTFAGMPLADDNRSAFQPLFTDLNNRYNSGEFSDYDAVAANIAEIIDGAASGYNRSRALSSTNPGLDIATGSPFRTPDEVSAFRSGRDLDTLAHNSGHPLNQGETAHRARNLAALAPRHSWPSPADTVATQTTADNGLLIAHEPPLTFPSGMVRESNTMIIDPDNHDDMIEVAVLNLDGERRLGIGTPDRQDAAALDNPDELNQLLSRYQSHANSRIAAQLTTEARTILAAEGVDLETGPDTTAENAVETNDNIEYVSGGDAVVAEHTGTGHHPVLTVETVGRRGAPTVNRVVFNPDNGTDPTTATFTHDQPDALLDHIRDTVAGAGFTSHEISEIDANITHVLENTGVSTKNQRSVGDPAPAPTPAAAPSALDKAFAAMRNSAESTNNAAHMIGGPGGPDFG